MLPSELPIGVSDCCGKPPYRIDNGPWRCGKCFQDCTRHVSPRQDSLDDQLRDVQQMANAMGCYDAADWIRGRTLR